MQNPVSHRTTCLFAFVLGVIIALLCVAPMRGAESGSIRLFEIGVHRYVPEAATGRVLQKNYRLDALGQLHPTGNTYVPVAVTIPDEAFDKVLMTSSAWLAYLALGENALANFNVEDHWPILIAERGHFVVSAREDAKLDVGDVVNLSTRGRVSPDHPLIGGFIVRHQPRTVLVRGIGPSLTQFGVAGALANPVITLYRGSMPYYENDDWGTRHDAAQIAATAVQVGAFALDPASKDSALVVELPPGSYTARISSVDGTSSGEVLLEAYIVP